MPELPEVRALCERLDTAFAGRVVTGVGLHSFSALKTTSPALGTLVGKAISSVTSRGKYIVWHFAGGLRMLWHLGSAGRVDCEQPSKATRPRGAVLRLEFGDRSVLVREHGHERRAAVHVLLPDDAGPLSALGPEPDEEAFAVLVLGGSDRRQLHTILRDQRAVAGIGRGYADDMLQRAGLSPFATLAGLDPPARRRLLEAVRAVLDNALARERQRSGGLSEASLGERFAVHRRAGQPCPTCGTTLRRVSFVDNDIVYCPSCQTGGRVLADRRLSRLVR